MLNCAANGANHGQATLRLRARAPRSFAAQFDTGSRSVDFGALSMVHDERDPAMESSSSTEMLNPIPGTWSLGDEPGDPAHEKKLPYFQSTMSTEFFAWCYGPG